MDRVKHSFVLLIKKKRKKKKKWVVCTEINKLYWETPQGDGLRWTEIHTHTCLHHQRMWYSDKAYRVTTCCVAFCQISFSSSAVTNVPNSRHGSGYVLDSVRQEEHIWISLAESCSYSVNRTKRSFRTGNDDKSQNSLNSSWKVCQTATGAVLRSPVPHYLWPGLLWVAVSLTRSSSTTLA